MQLVAAIKANIMVEIVPEALHVPYDDSIPDSVRPVSTRSLEVMKKKQSDSESLSSAIASRCDQRYPMRPTISKDQPMSMSKGKRC